MAKVTGEYPEDHLIPSLTVPFTKTQKGAVIVAADLLNVNHPINITNISGKTRGASVLLDDNTVYVATGNKSIDPWVLLGGSGGGGEGTVVSVNGIEPDEDGNITLLIPQGTVTSVNGIEPNVDGALTLNVVKTVNGAGPDGTGNINVDNKLVFTYFSDPVLTLTNASDGKLYILNGTGQTVTFGAMTKDIRCSFVGVKDLSITQGAATQFITSGDWSNPVTEGRQVNLMNNGNLWVMERPMY